MVVQQDVEPPPSAAEEKGEKKHKLKQRFQVIRKLGQGTYGKVQLAINRATNQEVAIKTIKKSKIETEQDSLRIRREIQIMSSIQHPYIIHIYEVFENKDKIVLVMQYASGGELYDYVSERKELTSEEARRIFRQVASAVYYCHKNKICHRDLKLENILLDEKGNAKIADFGLSNVYDERHFLSTFCGSPLYASPEIVKGTPYYGPEVDCWSLGVLLYTLVYGAMPFDGSNFKRLVRQISEADYYEPKRKSDASGLIRRLLTVDPAKRATVIDICQDRWVNQGFDHSLLQLAEDMSNLTPVRLDLLLALAPASPTPEEVAFDKAANPPDGAEKSDSFDFQPAVVAAAEQEEDALKNDDSADFIPAALAAELESQNIKRQCSTDGSLMRMSSVSHKNKKVRTSDSSRKSSVGLLGGPFVHDDEFDDEQPEKPKSEILDESGTKENDAATPTRQDGAVVQEAAEAPVSVERPMEQGETTANSEAAPKHEEQPPRKDEAEKPAAQADAAPKDVTTPAEANAAAPSGTTAETAAEEQPPSVPPVLARRGSGVRCPGKIVIPKCLSSQASPATNSASPKFKDTKKPPLPQTPKSAAVEPPSLVTPEPTAAAAEEPAAPERVGHKRVIPVPKRPKCKSPLSASPREREDTAFPAAVSEAQSDKSPSVERKRDAAAPASRGILRRSTSKPQRELSTEEGSKEPEVDNVLQSTAEIVLSSRKKAEEEQKQSSALWDNATPGTPEEEIPEPDAPPRRPSPEGSSADEHAKLAADSPVRSYKKFTFGKDGTCITESGRVYAQPKSDGSWTTVEKKTKITRRPSNATSVDEEVVRTPGPPPPKDELTVPRSASGSSSESTDIFNDMFPDWRTSSPFGNLMRMKSSIKKLNKGSLFRGADPFTGIETFRRERTPEKRAREWGRRGGGQVTTSTDRDSSDEDDFDLHFDNSHPQALFQFMRNMSRDFRNHWKSFLPASSSPFSRSAKEPSSQSSRPQRETLLRFVVDKPSKATGSEPGTPHARAMGGDPFSKRSSGVWDPVDRASLFGTLRRNRLQDLPGRHHGDRGTSLERGAGNPDFWGVHQDPEGTRHRVEKWLHLSNDNADPQQSRGDEGTPRCQQKYNRSQSDKFNLGEESRPVYQSEISVESNRTAPPGAPCSRSLSVNERGGGRRPLVRMQVSINNRSSNPNAHIVITTPPTTARTECGLWPQDDSVRRDEGDCPGADSSLLEALQTRGLRSLLSQRSGSLARELSPRRGGGEPPDRPAQAERGKPAAGSSLAPPETPACCMDTNSPKETAPPSTQQRPKIIPISVERRTSDASVPSPGSRSPGEESVQERIHRKSFYPRFHDDPRAAARRRSALWDTEYSGLWSQELRDRDDAALLRKSRSLWDNHVREPRSRSVARNVGAPLSVAPQQASRHGHLWDLSFDDDATGIPGSSGNGSNHRCNRMESKDYDSLESDGPPS
ncbi:LOW QUALITY PROTEIN: serine/threonine-protein kinase par-1-like [Dermacentor silvarum]|uniref:LOW QUALITY PROTEIN: serine/threonine-protein kinase par-1-like n=1 Tax=Dermacentor silvarum TaxID=543639 RepID=UPI00189B50F7|nr:LOW QUALITY PROTEIN: serine/threonine-protein kinase par-1-like [Dermacentor silvarum]